MRLARLGLARSFQLVQIFPELTVLETLQAAVVSRLGRGRRLLRLPRRRRGRCGGTPSTWRSSSGSASKLHARAARCPRATRSSSTSPPRSRSGPEAILLDEPTSGVSTRDKTAVMQMLVRASRGIGVQAILLVEHDMDIVFGYSDRIVALQQGRILADTTPDGLRADEATLAAMVGRPAARRARAGGPRRR